MSDETAYDIGNADSIRLVLSSSVVSVEYDTQQAQDEGHAKFKIDGYREGSDEVYETGNLGIGDNISVKVAKDAIEEVKPAIVYGFFVPEYLLGTYIQHFPDKNVYPQR